MTRRGGMASVPRREFIDGWTAKHGWRCVYCGRETIDAEHPILGATADHVIPRAFGGSNGHANLVLACANCNVQKANSPKLIGAALVKLWKRLDSAERKIEYLQREVVRLGGDVPESKQRKVQTCNGCNGIVIPYIKHRCARSGLRDDEFVQIELGLRATSAMQGENMGETRRRASQIQARGLRAARKVAA